MRRGPASLERPQKEGTQWLKRRRWASRSCSRISPSGSKWKRTQAREFFEYLTELAEKELKRSGEFTLPGMVKLYVRKTKARMGRNPATGEPIKIPAKTVVKARIRSR